MQRGRTEVKISDCCREAARKPAGAPESKQSTTGTGAPANDPCLVSSDVCVGQISTKGIMQFESSAS